MKFRILTGTALEVEKELNKLFEQFDVLIHAMSSTNEQTTVLVELTGIRR